MVGDKRIKGRPRLTQSIPLLLAGSQSHPETGTANTPEICHCCSKLARSTEQRCSGLSIGQRFYPFFHTFSWLHFGSNSVPSLSLLHRVMGALSFLPLLFVVVTTVNAYSYPRCHQNCDFVDLDGDLNIQLIGKDSMVSSSSTNRQEFCSSQLSWPSTRTSNFLEMFQ